VLDGDKLLLLPVSGSETKWYKNALKNPKVEISIGKDVYPLHARLPSDQQGVKRVVDKFREKYGERDLQAYYKKFDAAAELS